MLTPVHLLWSSIFEQYDLIYCYRAIKPYSVPQRAFYNYCKNVVSHDYIEYMQILL